MTKMKMEMPSSRLIAVGLHGSFSHCPTCASKLRPPKHGLMVGQGGKMTSPQQEDVVKPVTAGGRQLLWYPARSIQVAVLRGTTADTSGNISFEREPLLGDQLYQVRGTA